MRLSRRHILHGALGVGSSALLSKPALAAPTEKTTVVVVNLPGGLHSLYAQADSFVSKGWFGCSGSNTRAAGNGIVVDAATFGVWHGITAHDLAQTTLMVDPNGQSYPLQLARAMGASAAVACANVGDSLSGRHKPVGSTNISKLSDSGAVLAALGASPPNEFTPSREGALAGLKASLRMSAPLLAKNQRSLESVAGGLNGVIRALGKPAAIIDWPAVAQAYGIAPTTTLISGFTSQLAAAELLVHAGTNVVLVSAGGPGCSLGWDTHSDNSGECARAGMVDLLLAPLRTFLSRTLSLPGHNVITVMTGDFTRAAGSEHAGMLVASAWGPKLRQGTNGNFSISNEGGYVAPGPRPGVQQLWSFLAAAAGVESNPFGENPHLFV